MKDDKICPECKMRYPGHKLDCRTDNERARKSQAKLEIEYRKRKKLQPDPLAAAIARMRHVPAVELFEAFNDASANNLRHGLEAVRARLIQAAQEGGASPP